MSLNLLLYTIQQAKKKKSNFSHFFPLANCLATNILFLIFTGRDILKGHQILFFIPYKIKQSVLICTHIYITILRHIHAHAFRAVIHTVPHPPWLCNFRVVTTTSQLSTIMARWAIIIKHGPAPLLPLILNLLQRRPSLKTGLDISCS